MSHVRTIESLNQAGRGLLEVGSGDSPHGLQSHLEQLNESWEFVRCETERTQLELENRLSQVKKENIVDNLFDVAEKVDEKNSDLNGILLDDMLQQFMLQNLLKNGALLW